MIRHILAAADVSDTGAEVLLRASAITQQTAARLTILNVVEQGDAGPWQELVDDAPDRDAALADARSHLETLVSRHCAGASSSASLRVEAGAPHDRILSVAEEIGADLIVHGANQRGSLRDKLLGSTADRVVRSAQMNVLVVKRPFQRPYRKIAAAMDLGAGSDHVAEAARAICSDCPVDLVHVVDVPPPFEQALLRSGWGAAELSRERERRKNDALARLDTVARRVCDSAATRTEVIVGETASSLLKMSRRRGLDLMVIGREERGVIERVLLGSVALRLLHQAACDILIVGRSPA